MAARGREKATAVTPSFHVDPVSGIPIYRQLVDELRSAIKRGELTTGSQLPTVLAMADSLGLARGTVKRAYDELERLGLVEKVQGRGTFVCYSSPEAAGRKERAMAAIDALLDEMEALGFLPAEVSIFLNLKLRERAERLADLRVAVVECNPETLSQLSDQLRALEGLELYSYLLSHVEAYPYNLGEEMDLVVTTVEHAAYIRSILPEEKKIARIALRLSPASMAGIVKLRSGESLGILSCSQRFGQLLEEACAAYTDSVAVDQPQLLSEVGDLGAYLRGKTAVLVPQDVEKYAGAEQLAQLRAFAAAGQVIRCAYEMDEGSFLYLQEKLNRLRERKIG